MICFLALVYEGVTNRQPLIVPVFSKSFMQVFMRSRDIDPVAIKLLARATVLGVFCDFKVFVPFADLFVEAEHAVTLDPNSALLEFLLLASVRIVPVAFLACRWLFVGAWGQIAQED